MEINSKPLRKQPEYYQLQGWYNEPLNLENTQGTVTADECGCFIEAARKVIYRLSGNDARVWAVVRNHAIIKIRARYPSMEMDKLRYQVWKSSELQKLESLGGRICRGGLVALECGLWFQSTKADVD